jgi:hypothetical protein
MWSLGHFVGFSESLDGVLLGQAGELFYGFAVVSELRSVNAVDPYGDSFSDNFGIPGNVAAESVAVINARDFGDNNATEVFVLFSCGYGYGREEKQSEGE